MEQGKFIYGFSEGFAEMKDLLGGKGAGLAAMSRLGLPVPPGFTITAEACRAYIEVGRLPAGLMEALAEHLSDLEGLPGSAWATPRIPCSSRFRVGPQCPCRA